MEAAWHELLTGLHGGWLALIILVCLTALGWSADRLVVEAVTLSARWGVSKVVVGATVVSLGTTMPEAAVSVLAALKGNADLALGNAVGSIICDTGLILGVACLIAPLPLERRMVNRQGWLQLFAGFLLVGASWPWLSPGSPFSDGGRLPQALGFAFLGLLVAYIVVSIRWARQDGKSIDGHEVREDSGPLPIILIKLALAIAAVVGSSWFLIPTVEESAMRLHIPDSIIAATLVAFGTSLPELVTAVTAAWKGHGELAVGNVIGADILNVLFVAGAAAAVTSGGLAAPKHFFIVLFPAMLFVLIVFRIGVTISKDALRRPVGLLLLAAWLIAVIAGLRTH